jgi:hypothetical protein
LDLLIPATYRMLLVVASLGCWEYTRCLILQLNLLLHHKKQNSGVWQMLKANPAAFNEEVGEMSFSILARCTLGDTQKHRFKHISDIYSMIHVYRQLNEDIHQDLAAPLQEKKFTTGKFMVRDDSTEVETMVVFFQSMIRNITAGCFRVYDGTKAGYASKTGALDHMVEEVNPSRVLSCSSIRRNITMVQKKVATEIGGFWLDPYVEQWPEAKQEILPESGDEEVAYASAGDSDGEDVQNEFFEDGEEEHVSEQEDEQMPHVPLDENSDADSDDIPLHRLTHVRRCRAMAKQATVQQHEVQSENKAQAQDKEPPSDEEVPQFSVPEVILKERWWKGQKAVLVRWVDEPRSNDSWELLSYFQKYSDDYNLLVEDWEEKKRKKTRNKRKRPGVY